ncbi:MAG: hypothetical protein JWQ27_1354 [Ferruginibacter sp.]|nr:hypothetical protein [Ferruginibacter sp.]
MKKIYISIAIMLLFTTAKSQMVAWDFNGLTGTEASVAPVSADPDLAPTALTRGSTAPSALANSFNSANWTTTNLLADAETNDSYYQFTVQANNGFYVSLAGLSANFRRDANGPRAFQWKYSLDGVTYTNVGAAITYTGTATNGNALPPLDLSTVPALDNVPSNVVIRMRLYGYNAVNASGIFALGRLFGNDLALSGTVSPIVVPIRLISFSAANNRSVTQLQWKVNCTSTSAVFEIQRSTDAVRFTSLNHQVETQSRCALPFYYTDDKTPEGTSYYRLKSIDVDGHISYSKALQVVNKDGQADNKLRIYPTITEDDFATATIAAAKAGPATIAFIDQKGAFVKQMTISLQKGNNNISLLTHGLSSGTYRVRLVQPGVATSTGTLIRR